MSTQRSSAATGSTGVRAALTGCLRVRSQRWLLGVTLGLGLLVPVVIPLLLPRDLREFAMYSLPSQLVMSVTLPFLGAVMIHGASRRTTRLLPVMAAAMIVAAAVAAFGLLVSGLAFAATGNPDLGVADPVVVVAGPFLAQLLAQSVGTGMGLLIRWPVVAALATVVPPLGLYLLLGTSGALVPIREWITPLPSAERLLAGTMSPGDWAVWAVVVLLWGVTLNAVGLLRAKTAREVRPPAG